jgi:hypothetical protein
MASADQSANSSRSHLSKGRVKVPLGRSATSLGCGSTVTSTSALTPPGAAGCERRSARPRMTRRSSPATAPLSRGYEPWTWRRCRAGAERGGSSKPRVLPRPRIRQYRGRLAPSDAHEATRALIPRGGRAPLRKPCQSLPLPLSRGPLLWREWARPESAAARTGSPSRSLGGT